MTGWLLAALAWVELRRRLELVAKADHELRGPATAISLALEREVPDRDAVRVELDRLRTGLEDLACARSGGRRAARFERLDLAAFFGAAASTWAPALWRAGRPLRVDWGIGDGTLSVDRGRLAQAVGNLLANAAEHGHGPVELRARKTGGAVRVEVRNGTSGPATPARGRGRGIAIARAAAHDLGGRVEFSARDGEAVAALELPA